MGVGIILEFLKSVPWKKVLPIIIVLGIIAANFFYIYKLRSERDIARAKLESAVMNYEQCKVNRIAQDKLIMEYSENAAKAAEEKADLDEKLARAVERARSLASAQQQLEIVTDKYNKLREESEGRTVCKTYEVVLIALAGGGG